VIAGLIAFCARAAILKQTQGAQMRNIVLSLSVAGLIGCGTAALAGPEQDAPAANPAPAAAPADPAGTLDPAVGDKIECHQMAPPTGTRLGGHRECRPHHFWVDKMMEDRATANKIQNKSYQVRAPDGG
jgi:hypothetical protein